MKKSTAILASSLGVLLGSLHAQTVPPFINYQGKVTDSAGVGLGNVTPVNRKAIFRIFDSASGGARLWSEQHTVTISNGEFSVLLGNGIDAVYNAVTEVPTKSTTPLESVFNSAGIVRYVEIVVDNGDNTLNTTDAAIAPRQQITSTAYSFRARSADTITAGSDLQLNNSANYGLGYYGATRLFNGSAVDGPVLFGQSGGALGSVNGGTKNIALRWNAAGAVGIGSADLAGAAATTKLVLQSDDANTVPLQLNVRGNTDTNKRLLLGYNTTSNYGSLQAYGAVSTATNLFLNPAGGNVGVGTTTAGFPLSFASVLGDKISLWGSSGNHFGFGIQGALLQIHTDLPGSDIAFGYGSSATAGSMTELMRIKGTGSVGIGTNAPSDRLHVSSGNIRISGTNNVLAMADSTNVVRGEICVAFGNGNFSTDATAGDTIFRTSGGKLLLQSSSGASAIAVNASNNVGIGTTSPAAKLDVNGAVRFNNEVRNTAGDFKVSGGAYYGYKWIDGSGFLQADIFRYNIDNRLYFTNNGSGNLTGVYLASGGTSFTSTSDERLKSDIEPITGILGKIKDIRVVGYNMASMSVDSTSGKMKVDRKSHPRSTKAGKAIKQEIGTIAQDWIASFPEIVIEPQSNDQYYGLNYDRVGVVALGAVKELNQIVIQKDAEIATLKAGNSALAQRMTLLEEKLSAIEAKLGDKGAK